MSGVRTAALALVALLVLSGCSADPFADLADWTDQYYTPGGSCSGSGAHFSCGTY